MASGTVVDIPKLDNGPQKQPDGVERPPAAPDQPTIKRRNGRRLIAAVPTIVWCLAIAAAFGLFQRTGTRGNLPGFAEGSSATLAHFEPGAVRQVHVELYDQVERGQVIMSLDDSAERLRLAAVEKDLERLVAEVEAEAARLKAANAQANAEADDYVRAAALDREAAHIEYLTELMASARDQILLRGTSIEQEIVRKLHDDKEASFRELNEIATKADSLRAALQESTALLATKKQAFQEADRRWSRVSLAPDVITPFEPVLTPLRLSIDVKEQELREIVRQIDAHVLRAPIDGQITMLDADVGDRIVPGESLVTVSATAANQVVAYLPERAGFAPPPGTSVFVRCVSSAGGTREYAGSVVALSAAITEAPLRFRRMPDNPMWGRGLLVELENGARLMPGEAVAIRFESHR